MLDAPARALYGALVGTVVRQQPREDTSEKSDAERINDLYNAKTVAVMRRVLVQDSNCVDVGCHRGSILDHMIRFAPGGKYFAFEPLPDLFANLTAKYANVGAVDLHELALGEASGRASFQYVVTNPGYSGLKRRRYDQPDEQIVEINVNVARLDDVLPPGIDIRFVKIDVEGAELGVLRGSTEMLRRSRPFVVFEHGLGAADFYGT